MKSLSANLGGSFINLAGFLIPPLVQVNEGIKRWKISMQPAGFRKH